MNEAPEAQATAPGGVDTAAIRADIDSAQAGFHALVDSMQPSDWKAPSGNPGFTCGQLVCHTANGAGFIAGNAVRARLGKGFNPPKLLADIVRWGSSRLGARRETPGSVKRTFDAAHAKITGALDATQPNEWPIVVSINGEQRSLPQVFAHFGEHFREHEADVKAALQRK